MCEYCALVQIHIDSIAAAGIVCDISSLGESVMVLSKSRRKANDKYISEHYTRVALSMPKDEAAALDAFCKRHGLTKAGCIRQLIKDAIAADAPGGGTVPGGYSRSSAEGGLPR